MAKQAPPEDVPPGAPMWMATFGDLMSLLLTFFILLISFSTIEEEDYNAAMGSLQGALGTLTDPFYKVSLFHRARQRPVSYLYSFIRHGTVAKFKEQELQLLTQGPEHANNLEDVSQQVTTFSRAAGIANLVSVDTGEKGITIRIPTVLLFEQGSNNLKTNQKTEQLLAKIAQLVNRLPYALNIEGHTDNLPIANPEYEDNWELSAARAISVLKHFEKLGIDPHRMQAVGRASYDPYANNKTMRGRKLNRRVEISLDVTRGVA